MLGKLCKLLGSAPIFWKSFVIAVDPLSVSIPNSWKVAATPSICPLVNPNVLQIPAILLAISVTTGAVANPSAPSI